MGQIAHLRKQFKSINTYDYIITLNKRRKNQSFTLWEFNCSSFEQTWILFIQWYIVPILDEISPAVLEKKILKFCQCIFAISLLSPLEKRWGPSLEQTWVIITKRCIVPSLVEISLAVLEKKILKFCQSIFAISLIISPRKKVGPFIWTNLKPLHPRVHCAKFDFCPVVLEKKIF